jgi:hypothetical protein
MAQRADSLAPFALMFGETDEGPDALFMLQRWYVGQCNGDWEHQYGVRIDTLTTQVGRCGLTWPGRR